MTHGNEQENREFDEAVVLIDRYLDRTIGDGQSLRLLELLAGSETLQEYLVAESRTDFFLHAVGEGVPRPAQATEHDLFFGDNPVPHQEFFVNPVPPVVTPIPETDSPTAPKDARWTPERKRVLRRPEKRSFLPLPLLLLLILLLFAPLSYLELRGPIDVGPNDPLKPEPSAILTDLADIRWTDEKSGFRTPGSALYANRLQFESGALELLFYSGVRCVVEGPADFILNDRNRVFCRRGRWSVSVPPQASGFEIETRQGVIRDIGTQFLAEIDDRKIQVHVKRGVVEVDDIHGETTTLRTGQAGLLDAENKLEKIDADLADWIETDEMRRRSEAFFRAGGHLLKSFAAKTGEGAPMIYALDLDKNAEIVGGRIETGRTPESPSIRFREKRDRVRFPLSGNRESLTLVAWVRIESLHSDLNPILANEGSEPGGFLWHISGSGALSFSLRSRKNRAAERLDSPIVFTSEILGRWTQLAAVVDGPERLVWLYMDGIPVYSGTISRTPKLILDRLDLGNWKPRKDNDVNFRNLDGAVADLTIYDYPMNSYEIRQLQKAGDETQRNPRTNNKKGEEP